MLVCSMHILIILYYIIFVLNAQVSTFLLCYLIILLLQEGGEADLDIVDMVRTLSDLMQSGRSTTLAQAMREMGQPVTRLSTGSFIFALIKEQL